MRKPKEKPQLGREPGGGKGYLDDVVSEESSSAEVMDKQKYM